MCAGVGLGGGRYQRLSFPAVPTGRPIPPEAVSSEWQLHTRALERDEAAPAFEDFGIHQPGLQLRDKGYAITDLAHQPPATP